MELQFDKEMDAILRKVRGNASMTPMKGVHLDADTIAAFVEDSLPAAARQTYVSHLADCGRCRSLLAQAARFHAESPAMIPDTIIVPVSAASTAKDASAASETPAMPWYRKLFGTPGIALAMGAVIITFGGLLAYFAVLNGGGDRSQIAMDVGDPRSSIGPSAGDVAQSMSGTSNADANTMANSITAANTNALSNAASTVAKAANEAMPVGIATPLNESAEAKRSNNKELSVGSEPSADAATAQPMTSMPAPPVAAPSKAKDDVDKMTDRGLSRDGVEDEFTKRREASPMTKNSGPLRSVGPVQNQNSQQSYEMQVTRRAGGRTFVNRGGKWVDSGFSGGSPIVIRRGTDEYKKLPGGLRSIADQIGGTVVVIYSGKLYEIR